MEVGPIEATHGDVTIRVPRDAVASVVAQLQQRAREFDALDVRVEIEAMLEGTPIELLWCAKFGNLYAAGLRIPGREEPVSAQLNRNSNEYMNSITGWVQHWVDAMRERDWTWEKP